MDKILEKIMNFINENTMLLILVCVFLIIILIIYLIDNTIKTKKLEQEELNKKNNPEPIVPETPKVVEEPKDIDEPKVVEPVAPVVEPIVEPPKVEEIPVEPVVAPVVEEPKVEEIVPETPVIDSSIEELLKKDFSNNNPVVEPPKVEEIPVEPVVTPVVEEPKVVEPVAPVKSKYNNDKKLSDIFKKKEAERKIETTQDFSDELDRILQKLNNGEAKVEEDTTNYTNMF